MSPPPFIHPTAVAISWDSAKGPKRGLASGELRIDSRSYKLIEDNGTLRLDFPSVLNLSPNTRINLRCKTAGFISWKEIFEINTHQLFANFSAGQTQDVHNCVRVVFNCQTEPADDVPPTTNTDGTLSSTMGAILEDCAQFRILVIGKSGVGKSSLIRAIFGIDDLYSSDLERGRANVNVGLQSAVNERLILHDSFGFEPADTANYDTLKDFIRKRRTGPLKDRLHAIWFCAPIPRPGARLLESAAENFFEAKKETIGTIPLIVVYTKLDSCVNDQMVKLSASHFESNAEERALSEAEFHAQKLSHEIGKLAGESLPYVVVSTKEKYKYTLRKLVELTYRVGIHDTPEQTLPGVTLMSAQRVDPYLKVKGSIDVGRRRYWKTLGTGSVFQGHTISDCLRVIHDDIIAIWNFNDPAHHLSNEIFRELIVKMAQEVESVSNLASSGRSLVAAVAGVLSATSNLVAPIVLPVIASVAIALSPYRVYQGMKHVQQLFIAYIVDLTHVLETLSILTSQRHNVLTRRAIKAAYRAYYESDVRIRAHADIQDYRDLDGRDAALEKIESLITSERGDDANIKEYYACISELDLRSLNLCEEEGWFDQDSVIQ